MALTDWISFSRLGVNRNVCFFLNSPLNPILYCWKISGLKRAVKETLCCIWRYIEQLKDYYTSHTIHAIIPGFKHCAKTIKRAQMCAVKHVCQNQRSKRRFLLASSAALVAGQSVAIIKWDLHSRFI